MEVIIYADSLFILSFLYNIILFYILKIIFYHNCRFIKVAGAALCGAVADTLSPLLQVNAGRGVALLTVLMIFPVIRLFFKEIRVKRIFSVWVSYVFLSFFLSGFCQLVFFSNNERIKFGYMIAILPAGVIFAAAACGEYKKYKIKRPFIYDVRLKQGEIIVETTGFYDTGNGLFEPYTIKPVVLLEAELYESIFRDENSTRYTIPYTAVGTDTGMLEARELEVIYINAGGGIISEKVIAAKAVNTLSPEGYYRVILHPQLFI